MSDSEDEYECKRYWEDWHKRRNMSEAELEKLREAEYQAHLLKEAARDG